MSTSQPPTTPTGVPSGVPAPPPSPAAPVATASTTPISTTPASQPSSPHSSKSWRPSFGDLLAVGAVVITAITYIVEARFLVEITLCIVAIALAIFAALRHESHVLKRTVVCSLTVACLLLFAGPKLIRDFSSEYPHVRFQSPLTWEDPKT
jgi:hypothetical protein